MSEILSYLHIGKTMSMYMYVATIVTQILMQFQ